MTQGRIVAVIDVGSNSVRLLVARELSPVAFEVVDEERYDARLGQGQADGDLSPEAMERGLRALSIVTEVAASYGPSALVAVGTEALRRAPNAPDFIAEGWRRTGVSIRVLSAEEEAYASFLGVINSTGLNDGYLVDIGGGSLEVMRIEGRRFVRAQSAPLGAIYSTERFLRSDPPTAREVSALRKAVRQQVRVNAAEGSLYAAGGAVRNLARMVRLKQGYALRRLQGLVLTRRDVRRLAAKLASAPADARRRMPGVSAGRSDILHGAAIVLDEVMALTGAPSLTVSGQGLREGLVWQDIRGESAILPDVRAASVAGLARANGVNELAAEPVVAAAAAFFEATGPLHGLGSEDLDLLLAGARLAGIGMHVDYYNRDRHAEYLVHSGDLHGFSHREIVLLGALVRWAGSGTPDLSPYRAIVQADDSRRAAILTALLGAAAAVRRRMPSPVHDLNIHLDGDAMRIELLASGPVDAEVHALERQVRRLESVLKVVVAVEVRS